MSAMEERSDSSRRKAEKAERTAVNDLLIVKVDESGQDRLSDLSQHLLSRPPSPVLDLFVKRIQTPRLAILHADTDLRVVLCQKKVSKDKGEKGRADERLPGKRHNIGRCSRSCSRA
jgi:hypothetical protein